MLPNALWRLFFLDDEKDEPPPSNAAEEEVEGEREKKILQKYQSVVKEYLAHGAATGAFIIEAGDFSACASWWPPGSHEPPKTTKENDDADDKDETIMAQFEREIDEIFMREIWSKHGQSFWKLGLLARDPRKQPAVPGTVRAVLQPVIERAAAEGNPIWLSTTNSRAREIYLHFGWRDVGLVVVQGHRQWCMVLDSSPS